MQNVNGVFGVAVAAAIVALAACAAPGPTQYAAADAKGYGFSETRVEQNRYRVVYRGGGGVPADVVESYALRRAAELTLAGGYDWFRVVGRDLSGDERGGVSVGAGVGGASYGRRTGVGVGVGGNLGRVGARVYYTARLEVLMGSGERPEADNGEIYDARSVIEAQASGYDASDTEE
ncbi:MAG: hypothetical protein ACE5FO_03345 [Parvularculaceae bacterium]